MSEDTINILECPSYNDAIIGMTTDGEIVYSYYKIAEDLVKKGMCEDIIEAYGFIDYNVEPTAKIANIKLMYERDTSEFLATMDEFDIKL